MRILFLSELYSTPLAPKRSMGNARILRAMRELASIHVVSPVVWYPRALVRRVSSLEHSALPRQEPDDDGSTVLHPRRFHIPRVPALQAGLYTASLYPTMRAEVRRFRPDVILSAFAYPDGAAAAAFGKLFRLPTVCRVMGSDIYQSAKRPELRPQIGYALRRTQRVIAVSRAMGEEVAALGVPASRIEVIPTGVDVTRFHPVDREEARESLKLPEAALLIVVPSRLSPEKGIHHLLAAVARMHDDRVHVVLVGDGAQRQELERLAESLDLRPRVHFEGFQLEARMKLYYSAADLTCLPSRHEGWPDALMESFACGCPVVASDVGGVSDIIALTGSGLLAPPEDSAALARILTEALARPWDREATQRAMQAHTLATTAKQYYETCSAAVAHPRGH